MSALPGTWAVTMRTPIGSIEAEMSFTVDGDSITGTATSKGETVPLREVTALPGQGGEHASWTQSITKPMRLDLAFDVVLDGDRMHGHSRAGRLPRSAVTGRRV